MKVNKAAALERAITAEALKRSDDQMIDTIHTFCSEVYATISQRRKWITNVHPVAKERRLFPDDKLQSNQTGFRSGRSCVQQIHILRTNMDFFKKCQLNLTVTFVVFKKAFDSVNNRSVNVLSSATLWHPKAVVSAIQSVLLL